MSLYGNNSCIGKISGLMITFQAILIKVSIINFMFKIVLPYKSNLSGHNLTKVIMDSILARIPAVKGSLLMHS